MRIVFHRKKKFASCAVPFYIIFTSTKQGFIKKYALNAHNDYRLNGFGRATVKADFSQCEYEIPIKNGETLEMELSDNINSVFAMTYEGLLSNELALDKTAAPIKVVISAKGGWGKPSYPVLTQLSKNEEL